MQSKIFLSSPHMSGFEMDYIKEAFQTNWIAPLGPNVNAFENELADYVGAKGTVALSSGTAAIHLALILLRVTHGDIVFCSSLTFAASSNPILYQGAVPVFIDSEPESWNMSPAALEKAFKDAERKGKMPKAVIVVNLYGQSANYDKIKPICDRYNVPIIEDAAESLGATYRGKASGTFGKFGIFSFNGNKIITTSGGGALVSDDIAALEKARFLATQARDQARHYQHSELGYNYRLSNISAGIGRGQLKVITDRIKARRDVFGRYYGALNGVAGILFMPEMGFCTSNRWLTTMTVDPNICGITRDDILDALAKENIEARPVWKPMHLQPLYEKYDYYSHSDNISISDKIFKDGICLPSGSNLSTEEQQLVISIIKKCLR
ncbi:MAG: DegT/DnrJ/EryC1/StrS family aminotransferase [Bacillota bacterium]